jgi:murein DD-endopeptidase MepM/ murein hydrolase activator NlpD
VALAYRFEVKRGQRTEIEIIQENPESIRIFLDLFRVEGDSPEYWVKVASAGEVEHRIEFEPRLSLPYAVRLQPELLRGGRFTVLIRNQAALDFPIPGYDSGRIASGFGEPRDGGRRTHHGVDIFVPRHTPIAAPADGLIRRAGEQSLGGRTIWLTDERRGLNMYFAHLQEHKVEQGETVTRGQIIGTVGNSGNARTTPPHLHFGIYMRGSGPIDPVDFITRIDSTPASITAALLPLGRWVRLRAGTQPLKPTPSSRTTDGPRMERHMPMLVLAAAADSYRVRLPDGTRGYIPADRIELADSSLQKLGAEQILVMRDTPRACGLEMDRIVPGAAFDILGSYNGFWMVRKDSGLTGWVEALDASASGGR